MIVGPLAFVAVAFVLGGIVKGVMAFRLPTIAMGLLAFVMSPTEAAATLLLPSFATNLWQALSGPAFAGVFGRLWPPSELFTHQSLPGGLVRNPA